MRTFFKTDGKRVEIDYLELKFFLREKDFYLYKLAKDQYVYIQIEDNKVSIVEDKQILKFLFDFTKNYKFEQEEHKSMLLKKLVTEGGTISRNLFSLLPENNPTFLKDTNDKAYLFFTNKVIAITKDKITQCSYSELKGFIWKDKIKDFDVTLDLPSSIHELKGDYHNFLYILAGSENFESLCSIIGYCIHRYKNPSNAKAVIIYDCNVGTKEVRGRTGKTQLTNSLRYVLNFVQEDGRNHDPKKDTYAFESLNIDNDIFILDDAQEGYDFSRLLSLITGDLIIRKKYHHRFSIPFEEAPKVIISTNFFVPGDGSSFDHRRVEFFINGIFTPENPPNEYFGRNLYEDWDKEEWNKFYNVIFLIVQFYLEKGLIYPDKDRTYFELKNNTSEEFVLFAESLTTQVKYLKDELLEQFLTANPKHYIIDRNKFTRWLKLYANYKGWNAFDDHSGGIDKIQFCIRQMEK